MYPWDPRRWSLPAWSVETWGPKTSNKITLTLTSVGNVNIKPHGCDSTYIAAIAATATPTATERCCLSSVDHWEFTVLFENESERSNVNIRINDGGTSNISNMGMQEPVGISHCWALAYRKKCRKLRGLNSQKRSLANELGYCQTCRWGMMRIQATHRTTQPEQLAKKRSLAMFYIYILYLCITQKICLHANPIVTKVRMWTFRIRAWKLKV